MTSEVALKEKKLQLQAKSDDAEMPPSILAKNTTPQTSSSTNHPGKSSANASAQLLPLSTFSNEGAPLVDANRKEVVMAGGAYLKDRLNSDSLIQKLNSLEKPPSSLLATATTKNNSTSSIDYTVNPPAEPQHHKSPSVHAHFFVDETLRPNKLGNRSRSGSGSSSGMNAHSLVFSRDGSKSQESIKEGVNGIPSSTTTATAGTASHLLAPPASATAVDPTSTNKQPSNANQNAEQNANIDPRLPQDDGKIHVLLGVCGALSTGKIKLIISKLFEIYTQDKITIQLIMTKSSENFLFQESLNVLENKGVRIWRDSDEWTTWKARLDPVLHIELRRWADILVICPLTANTLSKISTGLCDNLLTNVIRAWNTSYPILLAPAMGSYSYNAITTKRQLRLIAEEMPWIEVLKPLEKVFGSYGDIGMGGMMDWNEVVNRIVMKLGGYPEEEDDADDDEEEEDDERCIDDEKTGLKKDKNSAIVDEDDDDDEDEAEDDVTGDADADDAGDDDDNDGYIDNKSGEINKDNYHGAKETLRIKVEKGIKDLDL